MDLRSWLFGASISSITSIDLDQFHIPSQIPKEITEQLTNFCFRDIQSFNDTIALLPSSPKHAIQELVPVMVEAIKQDNTQFISELLDGGFTIHSCFPLEAMKCKSKKALECFMQKGWDINELISDLDPPPPVLSYAIYEEEMTNWLLDHGANPNQRCDINCTPLSYAVQLAPVNIIELMLSRGGDVQQGQLLQYAIYRRTNLNEVLALLIDKGAPLNVGMYQDYPTFRRFYPVSLETPLHIATELGKLNAISFLLGRGADTSIEDGNGRTVIEWARKLNQTEVARLLENGH